MYSQTKSVTILTKTETLKGISDGIKSVII